jgi:iron complex transport system substrate-binding protein
MSLSMGWSVIAAVKNKRLYEIKSPYILRPGPAALTEGVDQIHKIVMNWQESKSKFVV